VGELFGLMPLRQTTRAGRAAIALVLTYAVGLVGLSVPATRALFQMITPVHLLLSLALLAVTSPALRDPTKRMQRLGLWLLVASVAYAIEVIGVQTGVIFGSYTYGWVLGPQLLQTPLMIGVNWLLLVVAGSSLVATWGLRGFGAVLATALMLVGVDALMEPVAMALEFWHWPGGHVPLQNYVGWFLVAVVLCSLFQRASRAEAHPLAGVLLCCQAVFFGVLRLTLAAV